jgi:hypothetical protein
MHWTRNAHKIVVKKPEGKRILGRRRCIWENNIKMNLEDVGFEGIN